MKLQTLCLPAALLVFVGWQQPEQQTYPHALLKEEVMSLEYTPAEGEIVVVVAAESELRLNRIELMSPNREPLMKLQAHPGEEISLQGFILETNESSPEELFESYPAGMYRLVARTVDGQRVLGRAMLSHELLPTPVVLYPQPDATVALEGLAVQWEADPDAAAYQVVLEQGDSDQLKATMPAGSTSFQVPPGLLQPNTPSHVEIIAVGSNGNCTVAEVPFTTAQ